MVDLGGALLTIGGGTAEGTGEAIQTTALSKMQEEALRLREERLANLRDRNAARSEKRRFGNEESLLKTRHEQNLERDEITRKNLLEDTETSLKRKIEEEDKQFDRHLEKQLKFNKNQKTEVWTQYRDLKSIYAEVGVKDPAKEAASDIKSFFSKSKTGKEAIDKAEVYSKSYNNILKTMSQDGTMPVTPEMEDKANAVVQSMFTIMGVGMPGLGKTEGKGTSLSSLIEQLNNMESEKAKKENDTSLLDNFAARSSITKKETQGLSETEAKARAENLRGSDAAPPLFRRLQRVPNQEYQGKQVYTKDGEYYIRDTDGLRKLDKFELDRIQVK